MGPPFRSVAICVLSIHSTNGGDHGIKTIDITQVTSISVRGPRAFKTFFDYQERVRAQRQRLAEAHAEGESAALRERQRLIALQEETRKFLTAIGKPHISV